MRPIHQPSFRSAKIGRWLLLSLLALAPIAAQAAAQVVGVRVWPAPEYTRITIESRQAIEYSLFSVAEPNRLVLDLENVGLGAALEALPSRIGADDPVVAQARVGRYRPQTVRVVLDLRARVKPQAFALPPVGEYAYRLVLDIYPAVPTDPVLALLERLENEEGTRESSSPARNLARDAESDAIRAAPAKTPQANPAAPAKAPVAKPSSTTSPVAPNRPVTIAIDAGHGGEDPGARGKLGTYEKDITLSIARRLKARINAEPNMRAVLTRNGDYFVPLLDRVNKARRARADLFVSIHADAFVKPHARGSSVFALSQRGATSAAARWLAQKENEADLIGGVNLDVADPYVRQVLLDLSQTATIGDSVRLGRAVLESLGVINSLHKPRVEQAGFAVLKAPDIPSILVETAFISNPAEERKLRDTAYQESMANAILDGIRAYLAKNPSLARDKVAENP